MNTIILNKDSFGYLSSYVVSVQVFMISYPHHSYSWEFLVEILYLTE